MLDVGEKTLLEVEMPAHKERHFFEFHANKVSRKRI